MRVTAQIRRSLELRAEEDDGGARLHSCIRALQMRAPATFFEDSAPGTWRALNGKWRRTDWIVVLLAELQCAEKAKVTLRISQNIVDDVDHLPAMVKLALPQGAWSTARALPEFPVVRAAPLVGSCSAGARVVVGG